jgi:Tol biopolymer transport system component
MFASRKLVIALTVTVVTAVACSSPGAGSPSPTVRPIATAASTLAATTAPTPIAVLPGEPWIVYSQAYTDPEGVLGSGILLVRPDGPDPHLLLTARAEHPDWSSDGKQIALVGEPAADVSEIWAVSAHGTDVETLVACVEAPCVGFAAPVWSPDGTRLAFQRYLQPAAKGYEDDQIAIEVLDLASGATRVVARSPVVADGNYVEYVYPRWSPDGTQIVFAVHRYPTPPTDENILSSSIAVVRADGSEVDAPRIVTEPALFGSYPDWSPDGQRIVFNTYPIGSFQDTTKAQNLYTVRPDGTGLTQVTHFGENDARAVEPTWTPDGKRIIFVHIARDPNDPMGARRIAFVDADGSNLTVLEWFGTHPRLRPTP